MAFINEAHATQVNGTTVTCNKPTSTADGHVMVARVLFFPNSGAPGTPTAPAGWTQRLNIANTPNDGAQFIYTKVASGEGASYVWTFGSASFADADILTYSGMDPTTPYDTGSSAAGASSSMVGATVTAARAGSVLLFFGSGSTGAAISTAPPTMVQRVFYDSNVYAWDESIGAGSTGTRTGTWPGTENWLAQLVVLQPAAASTPSDIIAGHNIQRMLRNPHLVT